MGTLNRGFLERHAILASLLGKLDDQDAVLEFIEPKDGEALALSGARVIALCGLNAFVGALAAAIAALVGTFPHWI